MEQSTSEWHIYDDSFHLDKLPSYNLFFELQHNKVYAAIFDNETKQFIGFKANNLQCNAYSNSEIAQCLNEYFQNSNIFQSKYNSITFFSNDYAMLIPDEYYDEKHVQDIVNFGKEKVENEYYLSDKLLNSPAKLVYAINNTLKEIIEKQFNGINIKHASTVFIDSIMFDIHRINHNTVFYINVHEASFEVLLLFKNKIEFFNSFSIKNIDDLWYYLSFIADQLHVDIDQSSILIAGEVEAKSEIIQMLETYARSLYFIKRTAAIKYSYVFNKIPLHYYHNLLHAPLCVS